MEPKGGAMPMVWVKDKAGNEFLCPVEALRDPQSVTDEEKEGCLDNANLAFTRND